MFFGMMRVKNEGRWITNAVTPLLEICDEVFILDDHSTDRTKEIIQAVGGCTVIPSPFAGLDESRDKTYLLREIERYVPVFGPLSPHWVVCVDGDEEVVAQDFPKFAQPSQGIGIVSYSFQILTLYDSPNQARIDPPYNYLLRPSMFRLIKPGMVFKSNAAHGGGFHCSNVPADIGFGVTTHEPEPVRVKHYGYMGKEDRERKYKFYVENDPHHKGWYQKECFGEPVLAPLPKGL